MANLKKILWPIDVNSNDKILIGKMLNFLKYFSQKMNAMIEPVYIVEGTELNSNNDTKFSSLVHERFKQLVKGPKLDNLSDLRILTPTFSYPPSIRNIVDALIFYLKENPCELVAIQTHARKGFSRFLLGSFTETLMLHCHIPLLILNPKCDLPKTIKKILFSTDFSKESSEAFMLIVDYAKNIGAGLVLFHHLMPPVPPLTPYEGMALPSDLYMEIEASRQRQGGEWVKKAQENGISTELIIDIKLGNTSDLIDKCCKETGSQIVALVSRSGPIGVLLGSTTRQVVRRSNKPVWVVHL